MDFISEIIPLHKSCVGQEGCGEGLRYNDNNYYYINERSIPKNKPALLTWEGHWGGRQHGDKEHIIVAWNGKAFVVLEHVYPGHAREKFREYKGVSCLAAIDKRQKNDEENKRWLDNLPKCHCGRPAILFDDKQPAGVCLMCFRNIKSTPKTAL